TPTSTMWCRAAPFRPNPPPEAFLQNESFGLAAMHSDCRVGANGMCLVLVALSGNGGIDRPASGSCQGRSPVRGDLSSQCKSGEPKGMVVFLARRSRHS